MSKASFPEQGERANNEIFETALQWACAEGCVCAFRCQHRSTWYFYTAPPPVNPQPLWTPLLHPPGWSVLHGLIKKKKKPAMIVCPIKEKAKQLLLILHRSVTNRVRLWILKKQNTRVYKWPQQLGFNCVLYCSCSLWWQTSSSRCYLVVVVGYGMEPNKLEPDRHKYKVWEVMITKQQQQHQQQLRSHNHNTTC